MTVTWPALLNPRDWILITFCRSGGKHCSSGARACARLLCGWPLHKKSSSMKHPAHGCRKKVFAWNVLWHHSWSYKMGMGSQTQTQQNRPEMSKRLFSGKHFQRSSLPPFFFYFVCLFVLVSLPFLSLSKHLYKSHCEIRLVVQESHFIPSDLWPSEGSGWMRPGVLAPPLQLAHCLEPITAAEAITCPFPWEKCPQAKASSPCYRQLIAGHPGEDGGICTFDLHGARLDFLFCTL